MTFYKDSIIDGFHQVDAQIKESVKLMFFGDRHSDFSESLLQWMMSKFVSKNDLQTLLQDLEMRILKNISFHMSVSNQKSTSEIVTSAVNAGISGISEAVSLLKRAFGSWADNFFCF